MSEALCEKWKIAERGNFFKVEMSQVHLGVHR